MIFIMSILDSEFDDSMNNIDECGKCPQCGKPLQISKKAGILYECSICDYKEYQWNNYKKSALKNANPILKFYPKNETEFKELLIKKKKAKRTCYDEKGNIIKISVWDAHNFTEKSNLRGNIASSSLYKEATKNGIIRILYEIEGYEKQSENQPKHKQGFVIHKKAKLSENQRAMSDCQNQEKTISTSNDNAISEKEEQMQMGTLKDCSISIYEAMNNIKHDKYVMPAFQRQYVWDMEQIEKLWDSILLDYPISTFLFWHIDEQNISPDTYFCTFLKSATFNFQKKSATPNYELSSINTKITDTAILDGQQRLTSLYLSLFCDGIYIKGKHERGEGGRLAKLLVELDKSKIENAEGEFNTKQYDIAFPENNLRSSPTKFEFRKLITDKNFKDTSKRQEAIDDAIKSVPVQSKEYARNLLNNLCRKVFDEKHIRFTEMHGINQDDALEMFVRFNSGGKPLKKSDITMSILEAYWPSSRSVFGNFLENSAYKDFGTDFIIRTALMLYGDVVKSNLNKKTADELKNNWDYFTEVLQKLDELLKSLNIATAHFSSSWNILLPVIYFIYYNPDYKNDQDAIKAYIIRGTVFTYFKSGTTGKLSNMRNKINECDNRITMQMLNNMNEFRVTEARIDDLLNLEYGSKVVYEILYYLSLDWHNDNIKYAIDHLHPASKFNNKPVSIADMVKWNQLRLNKDRLPNLHLLEGRENGSKNDMRLVDYYNDMNHEQQQKFRVQALIPEEISLEIEDFEEFYETRKKLLTQKIKEILAYKATD